jgi:hypothetical protein
MFEEWGKKILKWEIPSRLNETIAHNNGCDKKISSSQGRNPQYGPLRSCSIEECDNTFPESVCYSGGYALYCGLTRGESNPHFKVTTNINFKCSFCPNTSIGSIEYFKVTYRKIYCSKACESLVNEDY